MRLVLLHSQEVYDRFNPRFNPRFNLLTGTTRPRGQARKYSLGAKYHEMKSRRSEPVTNAMAIIRLGVIGGCCFW